MYLAIHDVVALLRNRLQGKTNRQFRLAKAGDSEKDRERPSRSNQTERDKVLFLALTRRERRDRGRNGTLV
jgi:hypothetical protein